MILERRIALFVGGTRSGKSDLAQSWLGRFGADATYVATIGPDDGSATERIARHRSRRPAWLETLELEDPAGLALLIERADRPLLVDSLGTWLVRFSDFVAPVEAVCEALCRCRVPLALVAELVGGGVHPADAASRRFVDVLGEATASMRERADESYLVVAGALVPLVSSTWGPRDS